jgi:hypothetical protein
VNYLVSIGLALLALEPGIGFEECLYIVEVYRLSNRLGV